MCAISLPYPVLPLILPFLFSPFFETLFFLSSSGLSKMDENRSRDLDAQDLSLHARFEHSQWPALFLISSIFERQDLLREEGVSKTDRIKREQK